MNFFEISVMENNCIEEVFQCIVKDIMEKIVEEWGKKKYDEFVWKVLDELSWIKIKSKLYLNCC